MVKTFVQIIMSSTITQRDSIGKVHTTYLNTLRGTYVYAY